MNLDQPAGASLGDRDFRAHHYHRFLPQLRAHHFYATTAYNARLSSSSSATVCLSWWFSSSVILETARRKASSLPFQYFRAKSCRIVAFGWIVSLVATPASWLLIWVFRAAFARARSAALDTAWWYNC